jgi:biotin operon repressor
MTKSDFFSEHIDQLRQLGLQFESYGEYSISILLE